MMRRKRTKGWKKLMNREKNQRKKKLNNLRQRKMRNQNYREKKKLNWQENLVKDGENGMKRKMKRRRKRQLRKMMSNRWGGVPQGLSFPH